MRGDIGIEENPPDAILGLVHLGLATAELLGLARLTGLERQDRQPLEGAGIAGRDPDQLEQLASLDLVLAESVRQPDAERVERTGLVGVDEQVPGDLAKAGDVVGRLGQGPLRLPDGFILGPGLQGTIQPDGGLGESPGQDCLVASAKPDAIVLVIGVRQGALEGLDRHRRIVQQPELAEHSRRVGRSGPRSRSTRRTSSRRPSNR